MGTSFKSPGLTSFHIEGLSNRASSYLDIFLETLRAHYPAPYWVKSKKIEEKLGISGPEVRGMIHYLRSNGHLIASSGRGYCYCTDINSQEMQDTLKHLQERMNSLQFVYNGITRRNVNLKKANQEELF